LAVLLAGVDITQWIELVLAIAATISIAYLASRAVTHFLKLTGTPEEIARRSGRVTRYVTYIIGSILIIAFLAFDIIGALVGLGIVGIAVGIGLGTVLGNIVNGAIVVLGKNFKVGDEIKVAFFEGKVVKMTIQRVTVEGKDGDVVFIPTGYFLTNPVARKCANPTPAEYKT
jgi:small-conductance mechanosensitive channel